MRLTTHLATLVAVALLLSGCPSARNTAETEEQEPSWSGRDSLLGTWANATLDDRKLPGDFELSLTLEPSGRFSLRAAGSTISCGPSGSTITPHVVTFTGSYRVRQDRLVLIPKTFPAETSFAEGAAAFLGFRGAGLPEPFTFEVIGRQLRLATTDRMFLVFKRQNVATPGRT